MVEKVFVSLEKFNNLCRKMCHRINATKYKYVFGVPRGGLLVAQYVVTHISGLTQVDSLEGINPKNVLIVDDLIDSGKTKEKYPLYDFIVLINKQTDEEFKGKWIEFFYEKTDIDDEDIVTRMLERIGEDPTRQGLKDTPKRVVKMWNEIFRGYDESQKPKITIFDNNDDGLVYDEMIVDSGNYYSHCEHHMVPFFGKYVFAYIPNKKILGISKVARIVDFYSARLQVQERLTTQIVDEIAKAVEPKGIALFMQGEHLCKSMRGVKKKGVMKTVCVRGVFREDPKARAEFLTLVANGGN